MCNQKTCSVFNYFLTDLPFSTNNWFKDLNRFQPIYPFIYGFNDLTILTDFNQFTDLMIWTDFKKINLTDFKII